MVIFSLLNSSRAGEVSPAARPANSKAREAIKQHLATTHTLSLLCVDLEDASCGGSVSRVVSSSSLSFEIPFTRWNLDALKSVIFFFD